MKLLYGIPFDNLDDGIEEGKGYKVILIAEGRLFTAAVTNLRVKGY